MTIVSNGKILMMNIWRQFQDLEWLWGVGRILGVLVVVAAIGLVLSLVWGIV